MISKSFVGGARSSALIAPAVVTAIERGRTGHRQCEWCWRGSCSESPVLDILRIYEIRRHAPGFVAHSWLMGGGSAGDLDNEAAQPRWSLVGYSREAGHKEPLARLNGDHETPAPRPCPRKTSPVGGLTSELFVDGSGKYPTVHTWDGFAKLSLIAISGDTPPQCVLAIGSR